MIAGRLTSRRDMGKANFIDIRDDSGRMQVYVRIDDIGEDNFKEFKKWDLGDIVGVSGFVFKTRRGEISVHAKSIKLLSKSLLPLPEKWHGLKDKDCLLYTSGFIPVFSKSSDSTGTIFAVEIETALPSLKLCVV